MGLSGEELGLGGLGLVPGLLDGLALAGSFRTGTCVTVNGSLLKEVERIGSKAEFILSEFAL